MDALLLLSPESDRKRRQLSSENLPSVFSNLIGFNYIAKYVYIPIIVVRDWIGSFSLIVHVSGAIQLY